MTTREKQGGGFQDWGQLRDHAIEQFGEAPHPATEQDIIDAYELHPEQIEKAIATVANDVKNGTARSGWGVLRARSNTIRTPVANPTRPASLDREKRIARAEQWMRTAGMHFDDEGEIILELFDTQGILHEYAQAQLVRLDFEGPWTIETQGDHHLIDRMTTLWQELRPIGVKSDTEAQERADKWKHQQAARAEALEQAKAELAAEEEPIPF